MYLTQIYPSYRCSEICSFQADSNFGLMTARRSGYGTNLGSYTPVLASDSPIMNSYLDLQRAPGQQYLKQFTTATKPSTPTALRASQPIFVSEPVQIDPLSRVGRMNIKWRGWRRYWASGMEQRRSDVFDSALSIYTKTRRDDLAILC